MQRVPGKPNPPAEPAAKGEVRWIERLQERPFAPATKAAVGPEDGLWITRLQQRAGDRSL